MKSLIYIVLLLLAIASWTVGDDLKDWIVAKHSNGAHAVSMGSFENRPVLVLSSADGNSSALIGLHVTDEKSEVYLFHDANGKKQTKILSSISFVDPVEVENFHPLGTSQNPMRFAWDKPIAEQNLKVGDWVVVQGYVQELINAHIVIRNGRRFIEYESVDKQAAPNGFALYPFPRGEKTDTRVAFDLMSVRLLESHLDDAVLAVNKLVANELWQSARLQVVARIDAITHQREKPVVWVDVDLWEPGAGVQLLKE